MTYEPLYARFDSPPVRRVRAGASDEDIGQHSWVTAQELREDAVRLRLAASSRLLDLGCGPGGPLTWLLRAFGGSGTGLDVSPTAVELGRQRAAAQGAASQARFEQADLDERLPLEAGAFDAAMALDVVIHLRDRAALFREVRRVLAPGGRLLFTDAGVLTGEVSEAERAARGARGHTELVPPGFNQDALAAAGLTLLETEDRTAALAEAADRRRAARQANRAPLEEDEGAQGFAREQRYLQTVADLARRRALSRVMYLAEAGER